MLKLLPGDCLEILPTIPTGTIDAVVTDPPYGITFMGKRWDAFGNGAAYQDWCTLWARECLRVLKPGGHFASFGGTRTIHRLSSAVEDAGFEIRDHLSWIYGQGFPKSLNLPEGRGTALKPSHEPIVLARKPLEGTVAANVDSYGTGALNIDAARVPVVKPNSGGLPENHPNRINDGRWPPNVLLSHLSECTETECAEGCVIPAMDAQSGRSKGGTGGVIRESSYQAKGNSSPAFGQECRPVGTPLGGQHGDEGGASRYFPNFRYNPKASGKERPTYRNSEGRLISHPTVKPLSLMRWLVRLVTPPNGVVLDPFAGTGTTGEASFLEGFDVVLIEAEPENIPLIEVRLARTPHERIA